ncbi:MAG TPA: hypothetical protein VEY07_05470 [Thermoplasmata archaeon]|nr:hypothetical protein [Thermoplasmata archaeon]
MGPLVAYSPALLLLALGVLAFAIFPPVVESVPCNCPLSSPSHPVSCLCPVGTSVDIVGVIVLLASAFGALVYTVVVWWVRRRSPMK